MAGTTVTQRAPAFAQDRCSCKEVIKMQSLFWSPHSLILGFSQLSGNQHGKSGQRKDENSNNRQELCALVALSCEAAVMWAT